MTLLLPTTPTVSFAEPEPGFWVASTAATLLGTIEHDGHRSIVRDRLGQHQGTHTTLNTAEKHLRSTVVGGAAA